MHRPDSFALIPHLSPLGVPTAMAPQGSRTSEGEGAKQGGTVWHWPLGAFACPCVSSRRMVFPPTHPLSAVSACLVTGD